MTGPSTPMTEGETAGLYVTRIEAHITRLGQGHDPLGHLFAIERLARAARAEQRTSERDSDHDRHGRRG